MPTDLITRRGPWFWIRADDRGFAAKAPLGTTRVEWAAIDGPFTESSDGAVWFRMKPEYLARRSAFFRLSVRATRAMYGSDGIRIDAARWGATGEELAAALNERLAARVGPLPPTADPVTGLRVRTATEGSFRRYSRWTVWITIGGILLSLLISHLR